MSVAGVLTVVQGLRELELLGEAVANACLRFQKAAAVIAKAQAENRSIPQEEWSAAIAADDASSAKLDAAILAAGAAAPLG